MRWTRKNRHQACPGNVLNPGVKTGVPGFYNRFNILDSDFCRIDKTGPSANFYESILRDP